MATVRVFARLKYEGQAEAFYDISSRVDYESLSWESNSEGTSANASIRLWTILPSSSTLVYEYAGATFADKVNAAISDESFVIEIPNKTEIIIFDTSTSPDTVLFSGVVTRVSTARQGGSVTQDIECADNTAMLEEHIIADYYAPRDSRDVDLISGSTNTSYTLIGTLPQIVGQVDGLTATSQSTGGNLSDGTYEIKIQAESTTISGRDGNTPQLGPVTKPYSITLSAGTNTQIIKVRWKSASNANRHKIYITKTAGTSSSTTTYIARESKSLTSQLKITSVSRSSNLTTIQTESLHGLSVGDPIVVTIPQTPGFSVSEEDAVVIESVPSSDKLTYKNTGDNGSASVTNAFLTSGGAAYIKSYTSTGSPWELFYGAPRGYADGEMFKLDASPTAPATTQPLVGSWFDNGYYRVGVGKDGIRGFLYPVSIFGGLFDKSWLSQIDLDVSSSVEPVDTKYRFSPYLPESDTANAEQFGGRTLRNALDYISEKTGAEYWIDRGQLDGNGAYSCKLHYKAKTPKELVVNGLYDGNLDGWTADSAFTLQSSTSGPYGAGYSVLSNTPDTSISTSATNRIDTSPGSKYFISVRGHVSDHQNRWGAYIDWYNSSSQLISSTHIGNLTGESVHAWERIWKIAQAPANAVKFGLRGTCTSQQNGSASFTDWSAIEITGSMGYGDFEDSVSYAVPVYEMEVPTSPVESGASVNRLHLYAVFRTKDENGNKVALTDQSGNPVQYVDYDFVPGIWATNGKIIEAAITDERVETLEDAELSAEGFWKENGLPIESYTFEMRPQSASGGTYPVPEVGDVIPFLWTLLGVAKPLIVKSVQARMMGMDVVYTITVGGDIRLQRSAFIRLSEKIKELDKVNPIPPRPETPSSISASANDKMISLAWTFDQDVEVNKNLASFEVQRQDAIYKDISSVSRSGSTVTINTSSPHALVANDVVRVEIESSDATILSLNGQWTVSQTYTNSFEYVCLESGTIADSEVDGLAYYSFNDFRTIQNTKSTYVNDSGLIPALGYRYRVRAISTDGTFSDYSEATAPISPNTVSPEIQDGSVSIEKLESSLRPLQIIRSDNLPDLSIASVRSIYPEGMIVYHLGGTPPGLRKVAVGGTTWENAINTSDVVSNSITTGLISAAGIDAAVIKSGKLTIDSRWGQTLGTTTALYKHKSGTSATLWTGSNIGIAPSNIAIIAGVGSGFDGSRTVSAIDVPTARKVKNGTTGALSLANKHAISPGDLVTISGIDASMNLTGVPVSHTDEWITHKTKWGNLVSIRSLQWHPFAAGDLVTVSNADVDANVSDVSISSISNALSQKAQGVPTAGGTELSPTAGDDTYGTLVSSSPHSILPGDTLSVSNTSTMDGASQLAYDYGSEIESYARVANTATVRTKRYHGISAGETIKVSGLGSQFNLGTTATKTNIGIIRTQAFTVSTATPASPSVQAQNITSSTTGQILTVSVNQSAVAVNDLIAVTVGSNTATSITNAVAFVGSSSATFTSNATGTLTLPVSLQNDVVLVYAASDGGQPATSSAGWTAIQTMQVGTHYATLFAKTMGATPDTSISFTGLATSSAALARVYRNCTIASSAQAVLSTGMPDSPAVTVAIENSAVVAFGSLDDDVISSSAPAGFANYAERASTATAATIATIYSADKLINATGAVNPAVWPGTGSDDNAAATVLLEPLGGWERIASIPTDPGAAVFVYPVSSLPVPDLVVGGFSTGATAATGMIFRPATGRTITYTTPVTVDSLTTNADPNPGAITTPIANSVVVAAIAQDDIIQSYTPPTGYSNLRSTTAGTAGTGTSVSVAMATKIVAGSGVSEDPGIFNGATNETYAAFTFAVYDNSTTKRHGIFSTSDPNGFIPGDFVEISGTTTTYNGSRKVISTDVSIISYSVTSNLVTCVTGKPHGFLDADTVVVSGLGAPYDGSFVVSGIAITGNPTSFSYSLTTPNVASTPAAGTAKNGKMFSVALPSGTNDGIATRTGSATNRSTVTYTMPISGGAAGSPVALVNIGDNIVSGAKIDNGKTIVISGLTAANQALTSAGVGADANNYRTINYTHPTSATTPYSLVQLTSSTNANGYGNATTGKTVRISGIGAGNIVPQSDTNGTITNNRVIRFTGESGAVAFSQVSPAGSIETKSDTNAIQSPNFTVDFDGNVTASNMNITGGAFTGGSINLGNGTFTVDNSGNVDASSISITDGFINLSGEFVAYTTGEVQATNMNITGGGINIGPNNFVVDGTGAMTAVGPILDNLVINPNGEPALLVSANSAEGDFAVPTGNRIDFGHWAAGTPGVFTPRLRVNGSGNTQASGTITGSVTLTASDINYKHSIEEYAIDPSAIDKINLYSFEWNNQKIKDDGYIGGGNGRVIGVIAQEIEKHLPIAFSPANSDSMATVSTQHLIYALIETSKDLRARLEAAEKKIAELEG
jgi:hypothetical protein